MNSYANMSSTKETDKKIIKKKETFIIPLNCKPEINYYTKRNMMKWLYTINCDTKNIYILNDLFDIVINDLLDNEYELKNDKEYIFCKFISWCFINSSNYKYYLHF